MIRIKTFDATGIAPNGRLFATDLNAIQDAAAGLTDLTQHLSVADIAIGESGLILSRFGAGEARLSGKLRLDGQILLGGDANLYRSAAGVLKTDGNLFTVGSLVANLGSVANQIDLNASGKINFGTAGDANLYRLGAGILKSDSYFYSGGQVIANVGGANQIILASDGSIYFGLAVDTRVYRNAPATLRTNGNLIVDGSITAASFVGVPAARHIEAGVATLDGSGNATVTFGTAFATTPKVVASFNGANVTVGISAVSTTQATIQARNQAAGAAVGNVYWIATE